MQPDVPSCIPTAHCDHNVWFLLPRVPNNKHSILLLVEVWASYRNIVQRVFAYERVPMPFTRKQRIYLLEHYLATKAYTDIIATFTTTYEDVQVPNKLSISWLVKKFRETGSVMNAPKNRTRTVLTPEKEEEIGAAFSDTPHSSIRKVARRTATSIKSTHCATRLLKLYPYRVSVLYEVNPADYPKRIKFCKWLLHLSCNNITMFDKFFLVMKSGCKWMGM